MNNSLTRFAAVVALAASTFLPTSAQAIGRLQWRATTCNVWEGGELVGVERCYAGFAYDTAIRAIKIQNSPSKWLYFEIGQDGVSFTDKSECLSAWYGGDSTQVICTQKSSLQLGIMGD